MNKALFLMDIEHGLEPLLQEVTTIRPENMLTIQSYGPIILHPYGDIMRSIIIAINQEDVKEIFVVGIKDKVTPSVNIHSQLDSMKDKIQTLDYLFQYCRPEFSGGTVNEWLSGKETSSENIEKCVNLIRHHPLVPSDVKVRGLIINNKEGKPSIIEVPTNKTVSKLA